MTVLANKRLNSSRICPIHVKFSWKTPGMLKLYCENPSVVSSRSSKLLSLYHVKIYLSEPKSRKVRLTVAEQVRVILALPFVVNSDCVISRTGAGTKHME